MLIRNFVNPKSKKKQIGMRVKSLFRKRKYYTRDFQKFRNKNSIDFSVISVNKMKMWF